MGSKEDCLPAFPGSPRALIHTQLPGRFPDGPPHGSPLRQKPLREALRLREGVVAQEGDNPGNGLYRRLGMSLFPVEDRPRVNPHPGCCLPLGEA